MRLTTRQTEIARLVAKGLTYREIAQETGVSVSAIQQHVSNAAERIPGAGRPRDKMLIFVLTTQEAPL